MEKSFNIGATAVGEDSPCYIIAEGCDNHFGSVGRAIEMARQAKLAGASAIKFQHHLPDEEMLPDVPMSANFETPLYEFLVANALTLDDHRIIKNACSDFGITYLCTPFSYAAAKDLMTLGVEAFKIGSGEMTDIPSLRRMAAWGLPMMISTGMSTFDEIDRTEAALRSEPAPVALFNCVSEYPPDYEDVNLNVIEAMTERYPSVLIGHSDHTPDIYTCFAAVTLGARFIEKHVTLDKRMPGPDQSVSIDFRDLRELCDGVRKIEAALGSVKEIHAKERPIREWAFRSVVTIAPVKKGEAFSYDNLWTKRPGTGIPSHRLPEIVGRVATQDLAPGALLEPASIDGWEQA